MEQIRYPSAHRSLLLVGLCLLGAAGAAHPAPSELLLIQGHDLRYCLETAQQLNLRVIARLPSSILVEGGEAAAPTFKQRGLFASSVPVSNGSYLYQVRAERYIDRRTLGTWGRVLVRDGNCAIIARDVQLTPSQRMIDRDTRLVPLDLSPKPYRNSPHLRLRLTQYDPDIAALVSQVDTTRIRQWVSHLQGFRTRFLVSLNRFELVDTIRDRFLALGISDVVLDTFATEYLDSLGSDLQINVVATIPGADDTGIVYVVGGHYDSYSDVPYALAPGADDNGTGLAAVMEVARVLAAYPPRKTVRCIAFAAEEVGDLGSYHYAAQADSVDMNIGFMLCNDVMGNALNSGEIEVYRYPGIEAYGDLLGQCASAYTAVTPRYIEGYYSSDDWYFWQHGYPAGRGKEYPYSGRWHTTSDSLPYISATYCAELTKAGLAMTAIMANYPGAVVGLAARDVGDGHRAFVSWQAAAAANVTGYRLYWGRTSDIYADSVTVSTVGDTIAGLLTDSLYYVAAAAIDDHDRLSPFLSEATVTPRSVPLAPSPVTATPVTGGVRVDWGRNTELDLAGYALYRRTNGGSSDSLAALTDSTFTDQPLSGADRYY
ncbi:M20/M25/M40 family metallo-hydrolase, partial [bacterium]|nr:M20/M25/M40 family metallo-hydrolase [bacterium]